MRLVCNGMSFEQLPGGLIYLALISLNFERNFRINHIPYKIAQLWLANGYTINR